MYLYKIILRNNVINLIIINTVVMYCDVRDI